MHKYEGKLDENGTKAQTATHIIETYLTRQPSLINSGGFAE